jgi:hypothetical protein
MASLLFTLATAFAFLTGLCHSTLDDYCTDVSYFSPVQYTTTTKRCCENELKQVCTGKYDTVCKEVLELQCEVTGWADCKSTTTYNPGKKCSVEYKDFPLKDCKEEKTSTLHTKQVPDCKEVTKNNCVTDWEVDSNGNKVWTGTETCTPVTWEECQIVEKEVEFPSVETECSTVANIKWADFVEQSKDIIGLETSCEMKSAVDCKQAKVNKCASVSWQECNMEPVEVCEAVQVNEPSQEKIHQKKCLT